MVIIHILYDYILEREDILALLSVMDWMFTQNLYVESLTPSMAVFGNEMSKEMIKVQSSHKGGALI